MNTRSKGQRTVRNKAYPFAHRWSGVEIIPIYQVSRWAAEQPFDLLIMRPRCLDRLVEVRTNQYGLNKKSTIHLSKLPGMNVKQVWRFMDGKDEPSIREWSGTFWSYKDEPWTE